MRPVYCVLIASKNFVQEVNTVLFFLISVLMCTEPSSCSWLVGWDVVRAHCYGSCARQGKLKVVPLTLVDSPTLPSGKLQSEKL